MDGVTPRHRPLFERFIRNPVNYRLVLVVDALGAAVFLFLGLRDSTAWVVRAGAIATGFAAWGFLEYALHRWVGHGAPSFARRGHAEHHSDDTALIAAPVFVVFFGAFAIWAWLSLVVAAGVASLVVAGLYLGYNLYALVHHVLHHHEVLVERVGLQWLERRHRIHHARQDVNFGVTSTLWDRLLGTYDGGSG